MKSNRIRNPQKSSVSKNNSQLIATGKNLNIIEKAFNVTLENNMAFLPGVVSRKKQVVPEIEKNL